MSGEPKTLTPEQEKAAREAFETRYKAFAWWTERFGTQHPALRKDENGDYLEEGQRKYWTGFQEGYAAALRVRVVARDEAAELREENRTLRTEADGWLKRVELLEAAIREWVEATSDAEMFELDQSNAYGTDHADAEDRVEAAAQALRRLAGGEGEK